MLNNKALKIALKVLTVVGIILQIVLFYFLFLVDLDYSQPNTPPIEAIMLSNALNYLLQLFLAYGLWNLYLFLQKDSVVYLKNFGVILFSYALLQVGYSVISSVILSWHLGESGRTISVNVNEMTFMYISFSLLIIYLSNLLRPSKK